MQDSKYREVPYNYTSFYDREIVLKYFDIEIWDILKELRAHRKTGRSAKLLFELYGDYFIIDRNPYIFNNFLENAKKLRYLEKLHKKRLLAIKNSISDAFSKSGVLATKVLNRTREFDRQFFANFALVAKKQKKVLFVLSSVTSAENIKFNAFHKVSHSTDATDWRVEMPFVVVYPDSEDEIANLVRLAPSLSLKIIPRGAGTGLTGGAIPVVKDTMLINTEKLNRIHGLLHEEEAGIDIPILHMEAGVVTQDAMDFAKSNNLIFSTDPTSAWACTVGGNIATNSGGKKAVIWGTAIDNIYSFNIVDPKGRILTIKRRSHPYRKILPDDIVIFDVYFANEHNPFKTISLKGTDIRKRGLGKDITNKALKGLPGIQKEGGDGVITSCKFILQKPFQHSRTLCLEFFGSNMLAASKGIVAIKSMFEKDKRAYLTALEHFDDKYIKAITYKNKSQRTHAPKAVLLIDIEGNDESNLMAAIDDISLLLGEYNTEAMLASSLSEQEIFWKDRKNLGAIAKDTNAFKLNEDVVIAVDKLPIFSDFVDNLNIRKDLSTYICILDVVNDKLLNNAISYNQDYKDDAFITAKIDIVKELIERLRKDYSFYNDNLNKVAMDVFESSSKHSKSAESVFELFQVGKLSLNFARDFISFFKKTFYGYNELILELDKIVSSKEQKKIVVATHMHAGDGNIHVNIPVHSNDYAMMLEADKTVELVINKTKSLGGVISGEHGIGLTKLKFLDEAILDEYALYKKEVDPTGLINPMKLTKNFPMDLIYTPSFNLLKLEAFILKVSDLEDLSLAISPCLRCGKCKGVCNTHHPASTMFYNPRNKVQGVALIIEAVLYDAQAFNELSFRHFNMLREISDHCTLCHKCEVPCPVDIDFGEVTLAIRKLLVDRKKKKFKLATWFALNYLKTKGYYVNHVLRLLFLKSGFKAQKIFHYINKPVDFITKKVLPSISSILSSAYPSAGDKDLRQILSLKGDNTFFSFHSGQNEPIKTVFYFPGCGSERMFPEISIATIALLYNKGIKVIIPPLYLCCGFPLLANGKTKQAEQQSYENRVTFHKMSSVMGHAMIKDIIISCGTCHEMLSSYDMGNIFEGSRLVEINEYIIKEKLYGGTKVSEELFYHDPCHSPMKGISYDEAFLALFDKKPLASPNCCGDGGTLALSTPLISHKIRERKTNLIEKDIQSSCADASRAGNGESTSLFKEKLATKTKATVLTTCPSCVQGLSKACNSNIKVKGKHMAVFLAEKTLGNNWKKDFIKDVKQNGGLEHILL